MPIIYIDSPDSGGVPVAILVAGLAENTDYLVSVDGKACWSGTPGHGNLCQLNTDGKLVFVTPRLAPGIHKVTVKLAADGFVVATLTDVFIRVQSRSLGASAYRIRRMLPADRRVSARVVEDERKSVRIGTVWNGGAATWNGGNAVWDRTYYGGSN